MEEKKARKKFFIFLISLVLLALIISLCLTLYLRHSIDNTSILGKIDDWEYDPDKYNSSEGSLISWGSSGGSSGWTPQANSSVAGSSGNSFSIASPNSSASADTNIGFSTGGAKDINNFRENIKEGYFPISTDITYNGLFYDYTFDTGNSTTNQEDLFYPSYSTAISKDPKNVQLYDVMGRVYEMMKDYNNAEVYFNKALEINPEYIESIANLGRIYYNQGVTQQGDANMIDDAKKYQEELAKAKELFKKALPYFEKAHKAKPDNRDYMTALRGIYYNLNMGAEFDAIEAEMNQ